MSVFKSIIMFILYYILFLVMFIGMSFIKLGIGFLWLPTLISIFLCCLFLFGILSSKENRPRVAIASGFIWVVLTAILDYIILVDPFLKGLIPDNSNIDILNIIKDTLNSINLDTFYKENIIILVVRYLIVLLVPFFLSLFVPKKEDKEAKLPTTTTKNQ